MNHAPNSQPLPDLPGDFGRVVAGGIASILSRQRPDGSILDPRLPEVYPQQAIFPMAFCWAGLDPDRRYHHDPVLGRAIMRLGDFLAQRTGPDGEYNFNSNGFLIQGLVDQRLIYAWVEAVRILREAGGQELGFERWTDKILRGVQWLADVKIRPLAHARRFTALGTGTGTNHFALYLTTVYRGAVILNRPDLAELALRVARALAEDMNPDGYWDEHSDLLRSGGPTPIYNHLTFCGMALLAEWTGEELFDRVAAKAADFHANFCYPDGSDLDVIDERVRYDRQMAWGLFGMSRMPHGRAAAARQFATWRQHQPVDGNIRDEYLARHCENALYWHEGEIGQFPLDRADHEAKLTLPGGVFRAGPWCVGLCCMRAINAEDPYFRNVPFALERQKLFSVWHDRVGLIIDGSNSKSQPANSTFWAKLAYSEDYLPCGGTVGREGGAFAARATYRMFHANVILTPLNPTMLRIRMEADHAGCAGPIIAAFTLPRLAGELRLADGSPRTLGDTPWNAEGAELRFGPLALRGPESMRVEWPLNPYNSYNANNGHQSPPSAWMLRVSAPLTLEQPWVEFELRIVE